MKTFNRISLEPGFRGLLGSLLGLALLATPLAAQVILNPVTLQGTVGFTNTNPTILGWLTNALSAEQTSEVVLYADSQPPAVSVQTEWYVVTNSARVRYEMTVDAVAGGVVYSVAPDWFLAPNSSDRYYFAPRNTPSLVPGAPPVTMDFAEAAGVLELRFVNSTGGPVAIQGLKVQVYPLGGATLAADSGTDGAGVPAGTSITTKDLLVPGGGSYWAVVTCQTGSNYYTDTVAYTLYLTNTVPRDQTVVANVVIPSGSQLARITGNVKLVGEFALTVPSWPLGSSNAEYPGYTLVEAYEGPFNNERWAAVTGTNFTVSASGPFVLPNLVARDPANPQSGYLVQAQIAVRTNRNYAFFESPALGYGSNPQLVLSPGTNADLGDLFVITPGYVDAPILLQGPPETPAQPSALRYLVFGADTTDPYGYGLPEGAIIDGIVDTYAYMKGSAQIAPGATWSASPGESCSAGTGAFNAATASYEGQVNLPVGGLASQPSQQYVPCALFFFYFVQLRLSVAAVEGIRLETPAGGPARGQQRACRQKNSRRIRRGDHQWRFMSDAARKISKPSADRSMTEVINNFEYRTTVGSDVDRDGFFAELTRASNGQIELVAEAFFNDSASEFAFTAFVKRNSV